MTLEITHSNLYPLQEAPLLPPSNIPYPAVHIFGAPNYPDESSSRLQSWWDYDNMDLMVPYRENAKIQMFPRSSKVRGCDVIQRLAVPTKQFGLTKTSADTIEWYIKE